MPTPPHARPVPLDKAYRVLNHGPMVLVSDAHAGSLIPAPDKLRTLNYVAGGPFYATGASVRA